MLDYESQKEHNQFVFLLFLILFGIASFVLFAINSGLIGEILLRFFPTAMLQHGRQGECPNCRERHGF
ncbi:MAG TPA: hypothetical protein VFB79_24000, partial [Candidatus Angelobacter sp.]|nr:hypothetical protein [Candidatus Angelobacter sp.]